MNDAKKQTLCSIGEMACECIIGGAIGVASGKFIQRTNCTKGQGLVVTLGSALGAWLIGRKFAKEYYRVCDDQLGTDFIDLYYNE